METGVMQFQIIDSDKASVRSFKCASLDQAMVAAGLTPGQVDFGGVSENTSIVVFEFGMFLPKEKCRFFSINRSLYVGNAVLFGHDERGETIDLPSPPPVIFYRDYSSVEQAINWNQIDRPQISVNGTVLWRWPEPRK
jgi:hypothetical protein